MDLFISLYQNFLFLIISLNELGAHLTCFILERFVIRSEIKSGHDTLWSDDTIQKSLHYLQDTSRDFLQKLSSHVPYS